MNEVAILVADAELALSLDQGACHRPSMWRALGAEERRLMRVRGRAFRHASRSGPPPRQLEARHSASVLRPVVGIGSVFSKTTTCAGLLALILAPKADLITAQLRDNFRGLTDRNQE